MQWDVVHHARLIFDTEHARSLRIEPHSSERHNALAAGDAVHVSERESALRE